MIKPEINIKDMTEDIPTNIQYSETFFFGFLQTITDDCFLGVLFFLDFVTVFFFGFVYFF